jgi:hypothetical protein
VQNRVEEELKSYEMDSEGANPRSKLNAAMSEARELNLFEKDQNQQ